MNESLWLAATDPRELRAMIESRPTFFRTRWQGWRGVSQHALSDRKLQLFATACCRRLVRWLPISFLAWLDWLEDAADGKRPGPQYPRDALDWIELETMPVDTAVRRAVWLAMIRVARNSGAEFGDVSFDVADAFAHSTIRGDLEAWLVGARERGEAIHSVPDEVMEQHLLLRRRGELAHHADLFRDLVGNPFHRADVRNEWRTPDVLALARRMYEDRDFGGMPVLADALEEAGCDDPAILSHCRDAQPHARGCWLIDDALTLS